MPADIPADVQADIPADVPADVPADTPADVPVDAIYVVDASNANAIWTTKIHIYCMYDNEADNSYITLINYLFSHR